jgi:hypothetical protein
VFTATVVLVADPDASFSVATLAAADPPPLHAATLRDNAATSAERYATEPRRELLKGNDMGILCGLELRSAC